MHDLMEFILYLIISNSVRTSKDQLGNGFMQW